ncbi:hypothetical protein ES705_47026 [subsurface metagenome]
MALQTKIKRFRLTHGELIAPAAGVRVYQNLCWAIDDKIRLIGISQFLDIGEGTLSGGTENSSINGDIACYNGAGEDTQRLLKMVRRLFVDDFTIGMATHMGIWGSPFGEQVMMFPEGYGIDFEPGDYIYSSISLLFLNYAGGNACMSGESNFYYVER